MKNGVFETKKFAGKDILLYLNILWKSVTKLKTKCRKSFQEKNPHVTK
jgi:hypothetical protein